VPKNKHPSIRATRSCGGRQCWWVQVREWDDDCSELYTCTQVYASARRSDRMIDFPFLLLLHFSMSNHVLMYCILAVVFTTSLWDLMGVCEKDAKSWEFLRVYPEIMKMRSWRPEVEENLCSGREANNMLRKLCVYCIPNVYDVVDSDFLEGAYLLQVLRKINLNCRLLQPCIIKIECLLQSSAFEICNLMAYGSCN